MRRCSARGCWTWCRGGHRRCRGRRGSELQLRVHGDAEDDKADLGRRGRAKPVRKSEMVEDDDVRARDARMAGINSSGAPCAENERDLKAGS